MPDLNGVHVSIVCDGQPLEEYELTYEGDTVTCWIPSDAGKVRMATQILPLSVDRPRSSSGRVSGRGCSADDTVRFRPSRFDGGFSLGCLCIMHIEFSTVTWTDEG